MSTLNVNDLVVVVKIIDLASEKGVFKGVDLKPIGEVRERLVEFIKASAPEETSGDVADESTGTETK
jgi:hypothetical protein